MFQAPFSYDKFNARSFELIQVKNYRDIYKHVQKSGQGFNQCPPKVWIEQSSN